MGLLELNQKFLCICFGAEFSTLFLVLIAEAEHSRYSRAFVMYSQKYS